ncbi:hypothetical protein NZD89_08140 [Alicyclobacillus fastidiosus]|uniref:Uncharacterized protein n=1 Tax=Alicyclobacillus fastidiosus TaxID=392011 RepID=A0ABY6ZMM8_9BACL|nr:hypothetical protein [Alicyclobacillus fastidiosus]WAH43349.1 hypothetical protein NZD89_08140 [Alicyclobacillus fastidiosus]GMA65408.1 hypothetical protein GCM10025859_58480 [Alicyclobacillus fastidiosus]
MSTSFLFADHVITVWEPLRAQVVSETECVIKLAPIHAPTGLKTADMARAAGLDIPQPIGMLIYDFAHDAFRLEDMLEPVHMGLKAHPQRTTYAVHLTLDEL